MTIDWFDEDAAHKANPSAKRNRNREDAGKSDASWIKHKLIQQAANGQINAYRVRHSAARIAIIDANAGDGEGVPLPQCDLFEDIPVSIPTPALAASLAVEHGGDVFLCERKTERREELRKRFPRAVILNDHADVAAKLFGYEYVLVISDPCGPSGHGIEHLMAIAGKHTDFIIVFNECFLARVDGVKPPNNLDENTPQRRAWLKAQHLYGPMGDPEWWMTTLKRRHIARTCLIRASSNFQYRVLVVANFLSDSAQRRPFERVK
jgi:hypothetical protein